MTIGSEPDCVWPLGAELGEGPVWSTRERALWFVDIKRCLIYRLDELMGQTRSWAAPSAPGFLAPLAGGGFIVGLKTGLHRFDPSEGRFSLITKVAGEPAGNRLNDGAADSLGRLWFGSMDDGETERTGRLYRLDRNGLEAVDDGYAITNGPAASPDGRVLYHTDSLERTIYAFDVDEAGGLHDRRVFVRIEEGAGYPDGSTVDAEGCLWTALWSGWAVRRYSPAGQLIQEVRLPCANITKLAFGGEDLRTAYVTTARAGLDAAALAAQPLAGGLFRFRTEVAGQPQAVLDDALARPRP